MKRTFTLTLTALAAALALAACDRGDRSETARTDMGAATSKAPSGQAGGTMSGAGTSAAPGTSKGSGTSTSSGTSTTAGTSTAPGTSPSTGSTSSAGTMTATSQLAAADSQFVTKAAAGGQYEVEVAKLAADKATDPQVKEFAKMLVDDHTAANEKLQQIASSHNVALPASLPADKKKKVDQLGKLSGAEFDKQFVKEVGLDDHKHDIADFEKAAKSAKADDVRDFAQSTLPTLQKHLSAAEKLPGAGKKAAKG
jgi:putative membrane protein